MTAKEKLANAGFVERSLDQETPERRRDYEESILTRVISQFFNDFPDVEDDENVRNAKEFIEYEGLYEAASELHHAVRVVRSDGLCATYTFFDAEALDAWDHSRGSGAAIDAAFLYSGTCDLFHAATGIREMGVAVSDQDPPVHFGDRRDTINGRISVFTAPEKVVRLIGKRHDLTVLSVSSRRFPPASAIEAAQRQGSRSLHP